MADKETKRSISNEASEQPHTGSPSKPSHYYDVSFDFQPEPNEQTPPTHVTKKKPSRWDHFYENYPKQQQQQRQIDSSVPAISEDPEIPVSNDEWHYELKGEKTVMAQSNEWLDRSFNHIKQLAQQIGQTQSEDNPYKHRVELPEAPPHMLHNDSTSRLASKWKNLFTTPKKVTTTQQKLEELSDTHVVLNEQPLPVKQENTPFISPNQLNDEEIKTDGLSPLTQQYEEDSPTPEYLEDAIPQEPVTPLAKQEKQTSSVLAKTPKNRDFFTEIDDLPEASHTQQTINLREIPEMMVLKGEKEIYDDTTSVSLEDTLANTPFEQPSTFEENDILSQVKSLLSKTNLDETQQITETIDTNVTTSFPHTDDSSENELGPQADPVTPHHQIAQNNSESTIQDTSNYINEHTTIAKKGAETISKHPDNYRTPLPNPDEIRNERERRRRLRVEQLEQLTNQQVRAQHLEEFNQIRQTNLSLNQHGTTHPESLIGTSLLTEEALHEIARKKTNQPTDSVQSLDESPIVKNSLNQMNTNSDLDKTIQMDRTAWQQEIQPSLEKTQVITPLKNEEHPTLSITSNTYSTDNDFLLEDEAQSFIPHTNDRHKKTKQKKKNETKKTQQHKIKQKRPNIDLSDLTGIARVTFFINILINVIRRFALYALMLFILLGALAGGIGAGYFAHLVSNTEPPSQQEMLAKINKLEQQSTIFYSNGEPIANVRADVVRSVSDLNDISPYIIDGLIATEDEHFYEHHGIMPKAILRATLQEIISPGSGTGGSTLTQQLVKQRLLSNDVTFFRKANEILLALRLEQFFSKDEILAAYLNVSPFGRDHNGNNIAGIEKAAEGVFGKKPSEVNLAQAAFLVGLPQAPYSYTPYQQTGALKQNIQAGIDRMHDVLFRMYRTQKISKEEYEAAINYDIRSDFLPAGKPHVTRQSYLYQAMENGAIEQLMRLNIEKDRLTWDQVYPNDQWYNDYYKLAAEQLRSGGFKVYTTIDKQVYDTLQTSAQQYIGELGVSYDGVHVDEETGQETYYVETVQNGLVVLDNASGKVLGFVAGTDYENNQIDHAFNMRRSPGSTIKPLAVYGPAIQENIINPSTIIPDTAFRQEFNDGTAWEPTNYGNTISGGFESARVALYKSDNLPAIRIYQEMQSRSVDIIDYLTKMGFNQSAYPASDVQNLAFSVGGVSTGPTVFEQTRAFATFANGGQYIEGYFIDRIEDAEGNIVYQHQTTPVQVFSEDSNYLMVDILRDTMTEGTGRIAKGYLQVEGDWIAKSGISENSKDVWFIASTPTVTIGSWIGYDSRYANYTINIEDGYGRESERSQHYWARIVNDLYAIRPDIFGTNQSFVQPSSVTEQIVLQQTGTLPGTVQINGLTASLTKPTYTDLFKSLRSAPPLSYNFLLGASEEDLHIFWGAILEQLEEERRAKESSSSDSNSSSSSSSSTNPNEQTAPQSSNDET